MYLIHLLYKIHQKYKKNYTKFVFLYVKLTNLLSFKLDLKSGPTYRRQVVNLQHQTPQRAVHLLRTFSVPCSLFVLTPCFDSASDHTSVIYDPSTGIEVLVKGEYAWNWTIVSTRIRMRFRSQLYAHQELNW